MTKQPLSTCGDAAYLERVPFALAHGARSSALFERAIHRSGGSTCADRALGIEKGHRPAVFGDLRANAFEPGRDFSASPSRIAAE